MSGYGRRAGRSATMLALALLVVLAWAALGAGRAAAASYFVDPLTGSDANTCSEAPAPCRTIAAAVERAEVAAGASTIALAAGTYEEALDLTRAADSGLRITGAGSGAGGSLILGAAGAKAPSVSAGTPGASVALAHLSVVNPGGDGEDGIATAGNVRLEDVTVEMLGAGRAIGVHESEVGSLAIVGGGVRMAGASEGTAIATRNAPLSVTGVTVTVAPGSRAAGISSESASLGVSSTSVVLASSSEAPAVSCSLGAVSLSGVSIVQGSAASNAPGLQLLLPGAASVEDVSVRMENPASKAAAVSQVFGNATFERLQVSGSWQGASLQSQGGAIALRDSRLVDGPESISTALLYLGAGEEEAGLLVQRSVVQAPPGGAAALAAIDANATVDSSELLGGRSAALLEQSAGKARTLTISASTLDAGSLGARDGGGVSGVTVQAGAASVAAAVIEGSILLEPQTAIVGSKGQSATVTCTNSDAPDQSVAASGEAGAVSCPAGAAGNTNTEVAALFSAPFGAYQPSAASVAIDAFQPTALVLPFGLTPSGTDLAGNPRVQDGNGDCVALQDKGALELQGHAAPCAPSTGGPGVSQSLPPPPSASPPVLSALRIAPPSFFAAPRGAHPRRRVGATLAWRDSAAASASFTVLRSGVGRQVGRSCRRPSRANRHGRRCRLLQWAGSFSHTDRPGADSLRFSGRLRGHALARGGYLLRALARDAAGTSAVVSRAFTIR